MSQKINYTELANSRSKIEINEKLDAYLSDCTADDPPYLSDALAYLNRGGHLMLERLGIEGARRGGKKFAWKINVLCDEFGLLPSPGDAVKRRLSKNKRDHIGNLISINEQNMSINAGSHENDYFENIEYVIDEKGCIECEFEDAVAFLNTHGIHARSGRPLPMNRHQRVAQDVVRTEDGTMRHPHYWRYKEVSVDEWESMPKITDEKPKQRAADHHGLSAAERRIKK